MVDGQWRRTGPLARFEVRWMVQVMRGRKQKRKSDRLFNPTLTTAKEISVDGATQWFQVMSDARGWGAGMRQRWRQRCRKHATQKGLGTLGFAAAESLLWAIRFGLRVQLGLLG
ncbi:uncharacterized protein LOC105797951 [Gossypium raimondii]|uniref:uncharacterized protein LOC105797951 n=1 Tax=Gossypium raimondii TaxID=29730 RepID=UPI00063AC283|nr:uncharacterized protein LOC105797951 [Gossypium raimondii]